MCIVNTVQLWLKLKVFEPNVTPHSKQVRVRFLCQIHWPLWVLAALRYVLADLVNKVSRRGTGWSCHGLIGVYMSGYKSTHEVSPPETVAEQVISARLADLDTAPDEVVTDPSEGTADSALEKRAYSSDIPSYLDSLQQCESSATYYTRRCMW